MTDPALTGQVEENEDEKAAKKDTPGKKRAKLPTPLWRKETKDETLPATRATSKWNKVPKIDTQIDTKASKWNKLPKNDTSQVEKQYQSKTS